MWGRLYASEPNVYRRQILAYNDSPRAERVKMYEVYNIIVMHWDYISCVIIPENHSVIWLGFSQRW